MIVYYDQQSVRHGDETEGALVALIATTKDVSSRARSQHTKQSRALSAQSKYIFQYLSMFWIIALKINLHLHKASMFVHSHVDKSIKNLEL